jgi:hypothetical protein
VTPATLRRWSDQGEVATFITPGGHRRFPRSMVEGLVPRLGGVRRSPPARLGASADRLAQAYRRARPAERPAVPAWLAALSEADRAEFRIRGQRLLGLLLEYLDADSRAAAAPRLEQARLAAAEYGRRSVGVGASLSETVEMFIRFRSSFTGELAAIARRRRLETRPATALLVDAEAALDTLLVAVMTGHTGATA